MMPGRGARTGFGVMKKGLAVLLLGTFALALAGCSGPCGFFWEDWGRPGKVCRSSPEPVK